MTQSNLLGNNLVETEKPKHDSLQLMAFNYLERDGFECQLEQPLGRGRVDIVAVKKDEIHIIEVKPGIDSVGDIIGQINGYKLELEKAETSDYFKKSLSPFLRKNLYKKQIFYLYIFAHNINEELIKLFKKQNIEVMICPRLGFAV